MSQRTSNVRPLLPTSRPLLTNDFGGASNTALATSWNSVGYSYTLTATSSVKSYVNSNAGAKLSF
ncbi:hypothetical protein FRC07_001359 [Ceratobasidium sp. 392]|nr:hypothetical protein FRC07_001359 [Ceratobasidium sp. 392]